MPFPIPFKHILITKNKRTEVTTNGTKYLDPDLKYVTRYGVFIQATANLKNVRITGTNGISYTKRYRSVITEHSNGYLYLLYSSKAMGLRRDSCLFPYSAGMEKFFHPPRKNRSDFALMACTLGLITLLADVHPHKNMSDDVLLERLPTYKELYG